jgi:hypothetical protein
MQEPNMAVFVLRGSLREKHKSTGHPWPDFSRSVASSRACGPVLLDQRTHIYIRNGVEAVFVFFDKRIE